MSDLKATPRVGWKTIQGIWAILPAQYHGAVVRLWFLMIIGVFLEMLGIGLVIPLVTLLLQPTALDQYAFFMHLTSALGNPSQLALVILVMSMLTAIYLIKNLYLGFLAWRQSKFIFGVQYELSRKLLAIYLRQPYVFHLQRNSAHLIRNVQGELAMFINAAVTPCLTMLAEMLIAVGLFSLLLMVEPLGSLAVISALLLTGTIFQRLTHKYVLSWGQQRLLHEGARIKQIHHALGGVKDVKLLRRELDFLNQYSSHTEKSMQMNQKQFVMQQMPRLWLELLAITGLSILLVVMALQGKTAISVLPTLALFAAACFRLMPSANRILSATQQLRYGLPVIDLLRREFKLQEESEAYKGKSSEFAHALELKDISYIYPGTQKQILDGVSLTISKGQMVGFIGESGSGKSTLIDVILGLLQPVSGQILVDGKDVVGNLRGWQAQIGYVPQSIFLTDDTLRRNVAFGLSDAEIDDAAVERALRAAQLEKFVEGLPDGVNTTVGERGVRLSGGQRQRIGIARALYHDPAVLVLDEATSALDSETEAQFMQAVDSLHGQKTILIVAHRLSTIEKCDRVYRMAQGKIISESTQAFKTIGSER